MIRRPPRFTRTDTLFPYTTLFRSITAEIASAESSIENVQMPDRAGSEAIEVRFVITVRGRTHLARVLRRLRRIDGVERVTRTSAFDWPAVRVAKASSAMHPTATRKPPVPGINLQAHGPSPPIAPLTSREGF